MEVQQYLRESVGLIRELSDGNRGIRKELLGYWIKNEGGLQGHTMEERRQILGHEMYRRGKIGFSGYEDIGELANVVGSREK